MKQFLLKTLYFILPVLFILIAIEVTLRNKTNDYKYQKHYLDCHSNEINTLILGSSYAYYGLDTAYFTNSTFNASMVARTLMYDYKILEKYKDNLKNLHVLILPVSNGTLFYGLSDVLEKERAEKYNLYWGLGNNSLIYNSELLINRFDKVIKLFIKDYILKKIKPNKNNLEPKLEGENLLKKEEYLNYNGKISGKGHIADNFNEFDLNIHYLRGILDICKSKNIKVILLATPVYHTYSENISPQQWDTTVYVVNKMVKEYGNITYVNMFKDTNYVVEDFSDSQHLSKKGAAKLSKKINLVVKNLEK